MSRRFQAALGLLVTLVLLMSSMTAFAAAPTVTSHIPVNVYPDDPQTIFDIDYNGTAYDWRVTRDDNGTIGPVIDRTGLVESETLYGDNVSASVAVPWNYLYDGDFVPDDVGYPHRLTVTTEGVESTVIDFYVNWMSEYGFDQVSFISRYDETVGSECDPPEEPEKPTYYPHNTVCTTGPHFRDVSPELTSKWYMFTPIDLGQDGTQEYALVGGNTYIIGKLAVTVAGDEVTVTYKYFNRDIWGYDEFFTFFPDYESITTVNPEEITSQWAYGKPLSISADLNGDRQVILFVCNVATFRDDNRAIKRFSNNSKWYKELRDSMLDSIGMLEMSAEK